MASMTLAEYKLQTQDPLRAGVIQSFIDHAPILKDLAFSDIPGGAISFNREKTLPTSGFRAVGAEYTADGGEIETITEALKIVGGKIEIDRALKAMYGESRQVSAVAMKLKSIARTINATFFKGDGSANSFTGLQARIASGQTVDNGAGGAVLSLAKLDAAILACEGDNRRIYANDQMYLALSVAMRTVGLAGNLQIAQDAFGSPVMTYAGIPVVRAGKNVDGSEVLAFTETNTSSSIYIVSLSPEGVEGVQRGPLEVYVNRSGEAVTAVEPEWYVSYLINSPQSAIRLKNITAGTIVA